MVMTLFGGLGLFLLGMSLLTEGLKALAGDSLRNLLARFTKGHLSALITGTLTTTFIQSSSATTLLTIGFISAGLLTFEQSIGLILGANLGTTSTAWIVSTIGLKIQVAKLALPLIGCGAGLDLFGQGPIKKVGLVFAGFGLLFLGIDMMQVAMKDLSSLLRPENFPAPGLIGSAVLVLVGAVMTIVMQSSSAAVATTLTAVHAGSLSIEQAMALVIGQNIGTTATAVLASIGGSISSRRAALAHTLFNVLTALLIFLGLPFLGPWTIQLSLTFGLSEPAQQLALFHSLFNLAGIVAIWPFLDRFTALIVSLVREDRKNLTRYLGPMVAKSGLVALEAARRTQCDIFSRLLVELRRTLSGASPEEQESAFNDIHLALVATRGFLADVDSGDSVARIEHQRHVELLHSLDHMSRLLDALRERESWSEARDSSELAEIVTPLLAILQSAESALQQEDTDGLIDLLRGASLGIADKRRTGRPALLTATAQRKISAQSAHSILEAITWVDRLAFHSWRGAMHLLAKIAPNLDPKAPPISEPSSSVPSGRLKASSATLPVPPKSETGSSSTSSSLKSPTNESTQAVTTDIGSAGSPSSQAQSESPHSKSRA